MNKLHTTLQGLHPLLSLALLIFLSIVLRLFSFFPTVLDHDESTYIIIADALLRDNVYLRDVFDTKPIGIFLLFGAWMSVFGKSILTIRLMTAITVGITAWLIGQIYQKMIPIETARKHNAVPFACGLIYIFFTSVFLHFGLSPNTELFTTFFAVLALFVVVSFKGYGWLFLAGLALGLGCMIKYISAFDALAIGILMVWQAVLNKKLWWWWFSRGVLMVIGFVIPLMLTWLYYRQLGMEETFLFFTFELSGRYFIDVVWWKNMVVILDFLGRFLPITIWFIYCSWHRQVTGNLLPSFVWIWSALAMACILMPGKLFYHYFIQLMAPMSLLAGSFFDSRRTIPPALGWIRKPKIGYSVLGLLCVVVLFIQKKDFIDKPDPAAEMTLWLKANLNPGDKIYTGNSYQIVYFLTETQSPTLYVHSSLVWDEKNSQALGLNQIEEFKKILDQQPRYILLNRRKLKPEHQLLQMIEKEYDVVKAFGPHQVIMQRI